MRKRLVSKAKKVRTKKTLHSQSLWVCALIVVLMGTVAYSNSFDAPLVFDDFLTIERNEAVRLGDYLTNLDLLGFGNRPLMYFTFGVNYALGGLDVWGYHLVNLLLHLINGILMLFVALHVLRQVLSDERRARWYAVLAATFFVVHPVQTESVTYISSRSELLSTFFYIVAFLLFLKIPSHRIGFLLSIPIGLLFVFGVSAKETVITLPAALLVYDFIFLSKGKFRPLLTRWKFYGVFAVGGAAISYYLLTGPLRGAVGSSLVGHLSVWDYFLTQLRVIVRYIQILFVPVGLNLDYDFTPSTSPFEPAVLVSAVILIAIVVVGWRIRRTMPVVSFSIFWFFVTLSPTSSFVPILDVIFEHRLYLPMVGLCLSFPFAIDALLRQLSERLPAVPRVIPVSISILLILTTLTVFRNHVWRDEARLWADVIEKSPDNIRGYNALAMTYYGRAEFEKALEVTRVGLERRPDDSRAFVDTIGNIYIRLGRFEEAADVFLESAESGLDDPAFAALEYNNMGVSYLHQWTRLKESRQEISESRFQEEKNRILESARLAFGKSIELDQGGLGPMDSYINVMFDLGRQEELVLEHQVFLEESEEMRSRYVLGKIAFNAGDFETAAQHLELASESSPGEEMILFNYAYSLEQLNRIDEAIEKYEAALRASPLFMEANHNVGRLYTVKGDVPTAIGYFEEVVRRAPNHVPANLELAKIYIREGDRALALQHLQTVLTWEPSNQTALGLLQQLGS